MLLAKSSLAASKMHAASIEKVYTALAEGKIESAVTVSAPILREKNSIRRRVGEGGKPAVTAVMPLSFDGENTLVECRLFSGRTHQIRVHLAHIGHPVVGDTLYGNLWRVAPHKP